MVVNTHITNLLKQQCLNCSFSGLYKLAFLKLATLIPLCTGYKKISSVLEIDKDRREL